MSRTFVANEIFSLKKVRKNLESRVKNLEFENHDLAQKIHPGSSSKFKEPKRSIIEMNPQVYNYTNAIAMKTKFMENFVNFDHINSQTIENSARSTQLKIKSESRTVDNGIDISLFDVPRKFQVATPEINSSEITDQSFLSVPPKSEGRNRKVSNHLYIGKSKPSSVVPNIRKDDISFIPKGDIRVSRRPILYKDKEGSFILDTTGDNQLNKNRSISFK